MPYSDDLSNKEDEQSITVSLPYRNPLSPQDTACWLEVINPTSTEMLLSGSPDGVLKVWDVHLNVHSHEMEKVRCVYFAFSIVLLS